MIESSAANILMSAKVVDNNSSSRGLHRRRKVIGPLGLLSGKGTMRSVFSFGATYERYPQTPY